nr:MAG TPA: hypothetical protein [Caudoviricetes sp.]
MHLNLGGSSNQGRKEILLLYGVGFLFFGLNLFFEYLFFSIEKD